MPEAEITRLLLTQTNRPTEVLNYWHKSEGILLDPPYQRGDVWGEIRQRNLIRSILMGVPIPSIIINDRMRAGWDDKLSCVVIDGKQRLTAIMKYLRGELAIPGEWYGLSGTMTFPQLPVLFRRRFHNTPVAFSEGMLPSLEAEKEVFDLVNFGGVPQGQSDFPS